MTFGEEIRKMRKEKGITMRELERRSGVSQGYLSQIETNQRTQPKRSTLKKLAEGLDVSEYDLMELAGYLDKNEMIEKVHHLLAEARREDEQEAPEEVDLDKIVQWADFTKVDFFAQDRQLSEEEKEAFGRSLNAIINLLAEYKITAEQLEDEMAAIYEKYNEESD